ncbi:hypothetical protein AA313_de0204491 [Arthrobotrys entomopaga]|nr:hypothetical protein AA313_de0204491 [Arthrobotrys entomopaga]
MSQNLREQIRLLDEAIAAASNVRIPPGATPVADPCEEQWGLTAIEGLRMADYKYLPQPGEQVGGAYNGLASNGYLEEPPAELNFCVPQDIASSVRAVEACWLFKRGWVVEGVTEFLWMKPDHQEHWERASQEELQEEIHRLGLGSSGDTHIARYIFELRRYGRILFPGERFRALDFGDNWAPGLGPQQRSILQEALEQMEGERWELNRKWLGLDNGDNDEDYIIEAPAWQDSTEAPAPSQRVLRSMMRPNPAPAPLPRSSSSSPAIPSPPVSRLPSPVDFEYEPLSTSPLRSPSPHPQETMGGQVQSRLIRTATGDSGSSPTPASAEEVEASATTRTKRPQKSCRKEPVAAPAQTEQNATRTKPGRAYKRLSAYGEAKKKANKGSKVSAQTAVKAPRKRLAQPTEQRRATAGKRLAQPKASKKVTGKRPISEVEDEEYESQAGPSAVSKTAGKTIDRPTKRPRVGGKTEETMAKIAELATISRANERAANPPASRNVWRPENHRIVVNSAWTCDWVNDEGTVCGFATNTKLEGQDHLFSHHVPEKKKMTRGQMFTCSMGVCNHTHRAIDAPKVSGHFDKSDKLKSHIRAIMDVREYGCPWEDYGCTHRSNRCTDITFHRKKCSFRPETKEEQDAAILAKGYKVL